MTTRTRGTRSRLDTDPLTVNQLGRIHAEFDRLGFGRGDRSERIRITAELAHCGPIGSTKELCRGEAGRVIGALRGCLATNDLYVLITPKPRGILAALLAWPTK